MEATRASLGLVFVSVAAGLCWPGTASAHIDIVLPESRYGPDMIKDAPCGHPDNPPGTEPPHVYQTGETVTIVIDEFVAHEGHLRIAWAENDEDIVTVTAFDDFDNFPGVLMDNIIDEPGMKQFTIDVTMPSEECDNCTLQVIQVMYDGDGFQEDDLYYTCADITLMDVVPGNDDTAGEADDGADVTGADDMGDAPGDTAADDGDGGSTGGSDGTDSGTAAGDDDDSGCAVGTRPRSLPWLGLGIGLWVAGRRRESA